MGWNSVGESEAEYFRKAGMDGGDIVSRSTEP